MGLNGNSFLKIEIIGYLWLFHLISQHIIILNLNQPNCEVWKQYDLAINYKCLCLCLERERDMTLIIRQVTK